MATGFLVYHKKHKRQREFPDIFFLRKHGPRSDKGKTPESDNKSIITYHNGGIGFAEALEHTLGEKRECKLYSYFVNFNQSLISPIPSVSFSPLT